MKNTSIIALSLAIFTSCNTEKKQESTTQTEVQTTQTETCYQHTKDSSTIKLNLKINGNIATGDLIYEYYQKDRSAGKIKGELKSDTLLANYTFVSEGVESEREVVFLKTIDGWVEGYGEIDDKDGKVIFKNKNTITFANDVVLKKTTCQ